MAETSSAPSELSGCPLDPVLNFLALKWLVHIIWLLGQVQTMRFAELQRQLHGVSAKVLSARLKQLEMLALLQREDKGTSPPTSFIGSRHTAARLMNFWLASSCRPVSFSCPPSRETARTWTNEHQLGRPLRAYQSCSRPLTARRSSPPTIARCSRVVVNSCFAG